MNRYIDSGPKSKMMSEVILEEISLKFYTLYIFNGNLLEHSALPCI